MAKQTGVVSHMYLDDVDISGDVGRVDNIGLSREQLDVTPINADYRERLPGVGDASMSFSSYFNNAGAHAELSDMSTSARVATVALGTAVGAAAASLVGAAVTHNTTRGADGSLVAETEALAHIDVGAGIEWGVLLTTGGKETFASAGSATASHNAGGSTTTGAAAVLHLFSIASGTVTFKIQDSADDSSFTDVTGLAFTAASAGTAQRVATAGTATIRRYTKVVATGTFGTAVAAVNLIRGI